MAEPTVRRCSIADALGVVGDRWSILVLREIGYGQHRFTEIQRRTGAPRDVLTARLRKLEAAGVLQREPDPKVPARSIYRVTAAGSELAPVLLALKEWGDRHLNPGDEPVITRHSCGAEFHPETHCAVCGERLALADLEVVGGDPPLPVLAALR